MAGCEIRSKKLIIKTEALIYQSKVNLVGLEILFGQSTHLLDSEIRIMLVRSLYGSNYLFATFQFC